MRRLSALALLLFLAACGSSGPAPYKGPIGYNASTDAEPKSAERDDGDALLVGSLSLPTTPPKAGSKVWIQATFSPYDPNTQQVLPGLPFVLLRETCSNSNGAVCDWRTPQFYVVATAPGYYIMTSLSRFDHGGGFTERMNYLLYEKPPAGQAISVAKSTAPRLQVVAGQASNIGDIDLLSVTATNFNEMAFRIRRDDTAAQAALRAAGAGPEPLVWQPATGPGEGAVPRPACPGKESALPIPMGC